MPDALFKILKNGLLPLLLGCGLFFMNIRPYHDWGDDFAQYLQEAQNLIQGKALGNSYYVYSKDFFSIGPPVYPPGFPILLTLAPTFSDSEILAGQYLVTIFLILLGWMLYLLLLRHKVPWPLALLLSITYIYHPWVLDLKAQILSDIPFTFFILLALYLAYPANKVWSFALAGLAAGFAINIRSAGWVLPLAGMCLFVTAYFRHQKLWKKYLALTGIAVITAFIINGITGYRAASNSYSSFFSLAESSFWINIPQHLFHYYDTLINFIKVEDSSWWPIMLIAQLSLLLGLVIGAFRSARFPLVSLVALGYFILIVIFPITAGFRFLLPLIPLLMIIATAGFPRLFKRQYLIAIFLLVMMNIAYQPIRNLIYSQQGEVVEGPQMDEAQEIFEHIHSHVEDKSLIMFAKPRALAYYSQRPAAATLWEITAKEFAVQSTRLKATHFLIYNGIEYSAMNDFVKQNRDRLDLEIENGKFALYAWKQPLPR